MFGSRLYPAVSACSARRWCVWLQLRVPCFATILKYVPKTVNEFFLTFDSGSRMVLICTRDLAEKNGENT
jgi:hypothetical protein